MRVKLPTFWSRLVKFIYSNRIKTFAAYTYRAGSLYSVHYLPSFQMGFIGEAFARAGICRLKDQAAIWHLLYQLKNRDISAELADNYSLIIDELGFVPLHRDGAELLFNVIAQAYERQIDPRLPVRLSIT